MSAECAQGHGCYRLMLGLTPALQSHYHPATAAAPFAFLGEALGGLQQAAAFAAPYGGTQSDVRPAPAAAVTAAAAADAAIYPQQASRLHGNGRDAGMDGMRPLSLLHSPNPQQRPEAQPGDSGGMAGKPSSGRGSSLGGSLKPPLKQKAQKAWRNRQKEKLQQSAVQLDTLQQEVQQLSVAQGMLQRRNEALERALHSSPAVAGGMAAAGASAVQQREQAAEQHTAPALGLTSAPWWLDAAVQAQLASELGIDGPLVFSVREDAPITLTQQQVAAMPHQAFGRLWASYISAMAACLLDIRSGSRGASDRLELLVGEAKRLELCVLLEVPDLTALQNRQPDAAALEAVRHAYRLPTDFWWQLLESAQLTEAQKAGLLRLREGYLRQVAQLAKARAAHEGQLPTSDGPASISAVLGCLEAVAGLQRMATSVCQIGRLLHLEQALFLRTITAMWALLTPVQYAHLNVGSPAHSSVLCAADLYATVSGQPSSAAVLCRYLAEDDVASDAASTSLSLGGLLTASRAA